jgi:CRP-like cAMP-binding protein
VAGITGAFAVAAVVISCVTASTIPGLVRMGRASLRRREQLRPFVEVLSELGIFEGASRQALERVASAVATEDVGAGTAMLVEGDPSDDLFVIRSGSFTVHHGDRQINTMGPGDWFGEIGLLGRMPRTATVRAATSATVWRIPGDTFLRALQEEAAPPAALIDAMSDRLARSRRLNGS